MVTPMGFATAKSTYDERGNRTSCAFFDAHDTLIVTNEGIAKWEKCYDLKGNVIKTMHFGINDKPITNIMNYSGIVYSYNEKNLEAEFTYLDGDGNPTCSAERFATRKSDYDERGNKISEKFYDCKGKPTVNNHGYSEMYLQYDNKGKLVDFKMLNLEQQSLVYAFMVIASTAPFVQYNDQILQLGDIWVEADDFKCLQKKPLDVAKKIMQLAHKQYPLTFARKTKQGYKILTTTIQPDHKYFNVDVYCIPETEHAIIQEQYDKWLNRSKP